MINLITPIFWKSDFYMDNTFSSKPFKYSISSFFSFDILSLMSSTLVLLMSELSSQVNYIIWPLTNRNNSTKICAKVPEKFVPTLYSFITEWAFILLMSKLSSQANYIVWLLTSNNNSSTKHVLNFQKEVIHTRW
jgi:hypothetical protein